MTQEMTWVLKKDLGNQKDVKGKNTGKKEVCTYLNSFHESRSIDLKSKDHHI